MRERLGISWLSGPSQIIGEGNERATDGTESSRTQTSADPDIEPNPEPRRAPPNSRRGLRNRRSQVRILSGALRKSPLCLGFPSGPGLYVISAQPLSGPC